MAGPIDHLRTVAEIVRALDERGLGPVLVGGMALVLLGSRRITRDFDFVIVHPGDRLAFVIDVFYDRGMELVSRLDEMGQVTATIDNRKVAGARLRLDRPVSAYFYNVNTGLRVDLLFDFPLAAAELAERARRVKIRSHVFTTASADDLMRLKRIAAAARSVAGDADDIAFLESLRQPSGDRN